MVSAFEKLPAVGNTSMTCESSANKPADGDVCRLLIVDDDPDSVNLLAVALRDLGHTIETARNGTEALTVAALIEPHMVLIDIGLPGLDGLYVTRELRKSIDNILIIA